MLGGPIIYELDPWQEHQYQQHAVGQLAYDAKTGDIYRYALVGGSDISAGKLQVAPTPNTDHHNVAAQAAVTADGLNRTVQLTSGSTAVDANEYVGGKLIANDVSPEGETYVVEQHDAVSASTAFNVRVNRPFVTNITTSSEFSLFHNTWAKVQESTTQTLDPAGVPQVDLSSGYYGWLLTRGVCAVLADEDLTLGAIVTIGSSTAGAVEEMDDVTAPIVEALRVGVAVVAGVDTEYRPVKILID